MDIVAKDSVSTSDMADLGLPLTPTQLKIKVGEITQQKNIPFKNRIIGGRWMMWLRQKHLDLTLRTPQELDQKRARALNPNTISKFYENLEDLYIRFGYGPTEIWNLDESRAQTNKNELGKVLARKGTRKV